MPNRISRRIHHQRRLTVFTEEAPVAAVKAPPPPCNNLPDELLADVFQCVVDDDFVTDRNVVALCATTTLSRVCRRWKRVTSSYSTLWERLQLHLTPLSNSHNIFMFPTWLKNSGCRPLELILDLRLDETDSKVYNAWEDAYARLASRRLNMDITLNLTPHVARLTRLDIHINNVELAYSNLWSILCDAVNLRELTLSSSPNEYVVLPDFYRLPPIIALSLTRFGFSSGFDCFKSSLRRLKLSNDDTWGTSPSLQDVVSWVDLNELTDLHLHPRSLEVLLSIEQLGKPFTFSALRALHFYNFEARELKNLLPVISTPEVEDFLLTGRQPFLDFLGFLTENDSYTFPKCTTLHLDANCEDFELEELEALEAAFPNVTKLHVRDMLSDAILQHLLPAEDGSDSPPLWPKLASVSFAWNEGNSIFHDQLFHLVEARRGSKHPLTSLGYTCPNNKSVDEGGLQLLKEYVTVSRLKE